MRLSGERKLFIGLRVDAAMKRQMDEGAAKGRPIFKPGDPAHLDTLSEGNDLYIGRIIEGGFSLEQLDDLRRNIRSIVGISFPDQRTRSLAMRVFAVEEERASGDFAATG